MEGALRAPVHRTIKVEVRSGYLTPAVSGVPNKGDKIKVGPTRRGRKCYITPAFSGVPNAKRGDKIKVGPKEGGDATSPLHSRGSPNKWGQNQNWLPEPCLLGDPQGGGNATSTLLSQGYPTKGTKTKH